MIKAAELPLNQRGAVYHLNLCPDELADTVITVGDPARVKQVSQYFDEVELKRSHREFVTHTGYLGTQRISVISTGIGTPNIDIVMNELDALANIDLTTRMPFDKKKSLRIVRLGTTGSLDKASKPGDLYVTRYAIAFDTLLNYYQYSLTPELEAMNASLAAHLSNESGPYYLTASSQTLFEAFKSMAVPCITATFGGFYAPQGRALRLPIRYPHLLEKLTAFNFKGLNVLNFEMETAAILGLGHLLEHQCLSLSVVLANRITGEFADSISDKVETLIEKALQTLSQSV